MKPAALLAAIALSAATLAGCSWAGPEERGTQVVAATYPLAFVAERIAGSHAQVSDLTRPGQEPHDVELTVLQTAQVASADLVVYERGFQPAVDDAVGSTGPSAVVDAGATAGLEGDNPHFWLDPERLGRVATAVEKQLAKVDPAHAPAYAADLATLQHQLASLDAAYRRGLANCRITTMVVSHDAYSYLDRYGVTFAAINSLSPDGEPSPDHLAQLRRLIQDKGVTTVFTEPLSSPATADTLARDAGVRTAVLDPIEGLSDATAHQDYLTLMRRNLAALRKAGGCS